MLLRVISRSSSSHTTAASSSTSSTRLQEGGNSTAVRGLLQSSGCSLPVQPPADCNGNGTFDTETCTCSCFEGFSNDLSVSACTAGCCVALFACHAVPPHSSQDLLKGLFVCCCSPTEPCRSPVVQGKPHHTRRQTRHLTHTCTH